MSAHDAPARTLTGSGARSSQRAAAASMRARMAPFTTSAADPCAAPRVRF